MRHFQGKEFIIRFPYKKSDNVFDGFPLDDISSFLQKWKNDQTGFIEIKKSRQPKTASQLGYWYAVVIPTVLEAFQDNGDFSLAIEVKGKRIDIEMTPDNVDQFLKLRYGEYTKTYQDKTDMSDVQLGSFISWAIKWSREWLGCEIPEPEVISGKKD